MAGSGNVNLTNMADIKDIEMAEFNYPLPEERIAKHPLAERDRCKLLVRRGDGSLEDRVFSELPELLPADTLLIYNNTRVINARVRMHKSSGALIEIFCLEPEQPRDYEQCFAATSRCSWNCMVGNSKRWKEGALQTDVTVGDHTVTLKAERLVRSDAGSVVEFSWDDPSVTFSQLIEAVGEIPIPPYLNRSTEATDSTDYQTVYSRIDGSVAAPTAGLHFTPETLHRISDRGIERLEVTLHVGAGTFQPVKSATIGGHPMHSEFIAVSRDVVSRLAAKTSVTAVGTTSVRTLESLYHLGCMASQGMPLDEVPQWYPYDPSHPSLSKSDAFRALLDYMDAHSLTRLTAATRIIIVPGYRFRVVDVMITNFHQPQSTLLLLVSAFTGGDWRRMYDHALSAGYRFLSYGDAELLFHDCSTSYKQ